VVCGGTCPVCSDEFEELFVCGVAGCHFASLDQKRCSECLAVDHKRMKSIEHQLTLVPAIKPPRIEQDAIVRVRQILVGYSSPPRRLMGTLFRTIMSGISVRSPSDAADSLQRVGGSLEPQLEEGWLHRVQLVLVEMLRMKQPWFGALTEESMTQLSIVSPSDLAIELLELCHDGFQQGLLIEMLVQNGIPIPLSFNAFQASRDRAPAIRRVLLNIVAECVCREYPLLVSFSLTRGDIGASSFLNELFELRAPGYDVGFELRGRRGIYHDHLVEMLACSREHCRQFHIVDIHGSNDAQHPEVAGILSQSTVVFCHVDGSSVSSQATRTRLEWLREVLSPSTNRSAQPSQLVVFLLHGPSITGQFESLVDEMGFIFDDRLVLEVSSTSLSLTEQKKRLFRPILRELNRRLATSPVEIGADRSFISNSVRPSAAFFDAFVQESKNHASTDAMKRALFPLSEIENQLYIEKVSLEVDLDKLIDPARRTERQEAYDTKRRKLMALKADRRFDQPHPLVEEFTTLVLSSIEEATEFGMRLAQWTEKRLCTVRAQVVSCQRKLEEHRAEHLRIHSTLYNYSPPLELLEQLSHALPRLESEEFALGHFTRELLELARRQQLRGGSKSHFQQYLEAAVAVAQRSFSSGLGVEFLNGDKMQMTEYCQALLADIREEFKVVVGLGPQSSGKSTLWNILFSQRFGVGAGRCTRGINFSSCMISGSEHTKSLLLLDLEGLLSPERRDPLFDRKIVWFAFMMSSAIVVNILGQATAELQKLFEMVTVALKVLGGHNYRPQLFVAMKRVDPRERDSLVQNVRALWSTDLDGAKTLDYVMFQDEHIVLMPSAFEDHVLFRDWSAQPAEEYHRLQYNPVFYSEAARLRSMIIDRPHQATDFPASIRSWCQSAQETWSKFILPNITLVTYEGIKEMLLQQAVEKAFRTAEKRVLEEHLNEIAFEMINDVVWSVRTSAPQLLDRARLVPYLDRIDAPQPLKEKFAASIRLLVEQCSNAANEEAATKFFDLVLPLLFAAPELGLALHPTEGNVNYLSIGHWKLTHEFELECESADLPGSFRTRYLQRCYLLLSDQQLHTKVMIGERLSRAQTFVSLGKAIEQGKRDIISQLEQGSFDREELYRRVCLKIDSILGEHLRVIAARPWDQISSVLLRIASQRVHEFPDATKSRFNSEFIRTKLEQPEVVSTHEKIIGWLRADKGRNLSDLVKERSSKRGLADPELSNARAWFRRALTADAHNWKRFSTPRNLEFLRLIGLGVVDEPPMETSGEFDREARDCVQWFLAHLSASLEAADNFTPDHNILAAMLGTVVDTVASAFGLSAETVHQELFQFSCELFLVRITPRMKDHDEARFKREAREATEQCDREKKDALSLLEKTDSEQGFARSVVRSVISRVEQQLHQYSKDLLMSEFSPSVAATKVDHSLEKIVELFYQTAFLGEEWQLVQDFLDDQATTVARWFKDTTFWEQFHDRQDSINQTLKLQQVDIRQRLLELTTIWKQALCGQGTVEPSIPLPRSEVAKHLVFFLRNGRFPSGSEPGANVTEQCQLDSSFTSSQRTVDLSLESAFTGGDIGCDIDRLSTALEVEMRQTIHAPSDCEAILLSADEYDALFEAYYAQCTGTCRQACPYCGSLCIKNHRRFGNPSEPGGKHRACRHFVMCMIGWHRKIGEVAFISCTDPSRVNAHYRVPGTKDTYLPWAKHIEQCNPDWEIPQNDQDADVNDEMEYSIRLALVTLFPHIKAKFNLPNELPEDFRRLFVSRITPQQDPMTIKRRSHPVRVLSLDGGGLRGLMTLKILDSIEQATGVPTWKLFDLIIGTSVGAVIASALGVLKWSARKCMQLLQEMATKIFPDQGAIRTGINFISQAGKYDNGPLIAMLKEKFGPTRELRQLAREWPKVCIVAARASVGGAAVQYNFRTYAPSNTDRAYYNGTTREESSVKLWEAILASASAPVYFPPVKITFDGVEHTFVDGGIVANNPGATALREAALLTTAQRSVQLMVSIGTGTESLRQHPAATRPHFDVFGTVLKVGKAWLTGGPVGALGAAGVAAAEHAVSHVTHAVQRSNPLMLIDTLTQSDTVHRECHKQSRAAGPEFEYFRLNPTRLADRSMDDSQMAALALLDECARRYIHDPETQELLRNITRSLLARRFWVSLSTANELAICQHTSMMSPFDETKFSGMPDGVQWNKARDCIAVAQIPAGTEPNQVEVKYDGVPLAVVPVRDWD